MKALESWGWVELIEWKEWVNEMKLAGKKVCGNDA